jgi:2-oxoglutarate ferredoxin oxidoreductase subunit beta
MSATIQAAIEHRGMAFVDILQPCPTYNNLHTKDWYGEEIEVEGVKMPRTYKLDETDYNGVVPDGHNEEAMERVKAKALERVTISEERIPLGLFYKVDQSTYMDRVRENVEPLRGTTSAKLEFEDANHNPTTDLSDLYKEFLTDTY